jgi:hypothetical protein
MAAFGPRKGVEPTPEALQQSSPAAFRELELKFQIAVGLPNATAMLELASQANPSQPRQL